MDTVADFFVDPLVWPAYIYAAAYGFVWFAAWGLAQLMLHKCGIERATTRAWGIALLLHLLFGIGLACWICVRAAPRVAEWWHIPLYLIFCVPIVLVDICLLVLLLAKKSAK